MMFLLGYKLKIVAYGGWERLKKIKQFQEDSKKYVLSTLCLDFFWNNPILFRGHLHLESSHDLRQINASVLLKYFQFYEKKYWFD